MAGLIGARSAAVEPVAMMPSFSSTTWKVVAAVNTSAHLPPMLPLLVTTGG
ncbi:hypothetical protein D9M69_670220 [compost metagenome]